MLKKVKIFTDGSCLGNPGPGGYGIILSYKIHEKIHEKILTKGFYFTTNNRMELMAVIVGLESLKNLCSAKIITDSKYIKNGITSWINQWKENKWKTTKNKPVKNIDLWLRLENATKKHIVQWIWIKGHIGHIYNERCDKIARLSARKPCEHDNYHEKKNK